MIPPTRYLSRSPMVTQLVLAIVGLVTLRKGSPKCLVILQMYSFGLGEVGILVCF